MPRIAVTIAAAALIALSGQADGREGSDPRTGLEELRARLALTSGQETQVRSLFEKHLEAQRATLEKYDVDAGDRDSADTVDLQKMRALHEDLRANRAKIEGRLSEAQLAAYEALQAKQRKKLRSLLRQR